MELVRLEMDIIPKQSLEIQLVREHSLADGKGGSQILAEKLLLGVRLQGADQLTIDLDLILLALFGYDVGGLLLLKDFALSVTDLLSLGAAEVVVVQGVGNAHSRDIDLSLGGDDVDLVDSPKRASVDAEGASDEQKSGGQLLQENHALSLVGAGHQNQDRAGSDGRAQFAVVLAERLLVGGLPLLAALRGQSARHFLQLDDALVAVLLTADLLGHSRRLLDHWSLLRLLVLDESGLLVVHLGPGEPHDSSIDLRVTGCVNHGFGDTPKSFYIKFLLIYDPFKQIETTQL